MLKVPFGIAVVRFYRRLCTEELCGKTRNNSWFIITYLTSISGMGGGCTSAN